MFKNFTEDAIIVLDDAANEAIRLDDSFIGVEHIFLSLLFHKIGPAYEILTKFGFEYVKVSLAFEGLRPDYKKNSLFDRPTFSSRSRQIIDASCSSAYKFGVTTVDTIHILLAIMDFIEGDALLRYFSINKTDFLIAIYEVIENSNGNNEYFLINEKIQNSDLTNYLQNMTEQAKQGNFDPVIGRSKEIDRIIQILARRRKNNPVLTGEPGVGKTAIIEGLAQRLISGDVPSFLDKKVIFSLNLTALVAGASARGEFEKRLNEIIALFTSSSLIILFIDEIHMLVGAGSNEGGMDAANILKPVLARGELQCIGATTTDEYLQNIEKDPAFERRFQPVKVPEPTINETIEILRGLKKGYENYHDVVITDEALIAASNLGVEFIADRLLPDKAIDLLDEACAHVRLLKPKIQGEVAKKLEKKLNNALNLKNVSILKNKFLDANIYYNNEILLRAELNAILYVKKSKKNKVVDDHKPQVLESDISDAVVEFTGIPIAKVSKEEAKNLLKMEEILHQRIIGQEIAVSAVSKAIRRARVGLKNPARPIASFIFAGPTGVGKTELTKALAASFFGSEDSMVRFDMSEYMESHNVAKLIGSPPGYIGFADGGILTEKVRQNPHSIVLFDEVEKAHPDVFNLLLQILDDGRLTDSKGRLISFKNTLIILTSNIGSKIIENESSIYHEEFTFIEREEDFARLTKSVNTELKNFFKPEFLNRLDEIIIFHQLRQKDIAKIANIMLKNLIQMVKKKGIELYIMDDVKTKIAIDGFNPIYGARPLRRVIASYLEDELANIFLAKQLDPGTKIVCNLDKSFNINFEVIPFGHLKFNTLNLLIENEINSENNLKLDNKIKNEKTKSKLFPQIIRKNRFKLPDNKINENDSRCLKVYKKMRIK